MANIDILQHTPMNGTTAKTVFQYDPPVSIAGKICKCWVAGYFTNDNTWDNVIVSSNWTQINSIKVPSKTAASQLGTYGTLTPSAYSTTTLTYTGTLSPAFVVGAYIYGTNVSTNATITAIDTTGKVITFTPAATTAPSGDILASSLSYATINVNYNIEPLSQSNVLGYISSTQSSSDHSISYVRIPDGPHEVAITCDFDNSTIIPSDTKTLQLRIHIEPMDQRYHYEKLVSNKSGPSIII